MDFKDVLNHDEKFRYQLLFRMKSDCDYYLGPGGRCAKHLWAGDEVKQIAYMKALWNSFCEEGKPAWLSYNDILDYEKKIGIPAILVEMDYKGYYERFALTPEEFKEEFPDTYENFGPIEESNSDTLRPFVHIWFEPCVVGDELWNDFFTDMELGLPESDIESGNLAYIDKDQMQSLSKYLEDISVYHCKAEFKHDDVIAAEEEIKLQVMSAVKEPDYVVENMKCVEEFPADDLLDVSDDCFFIFEFDVKMPRDSSTSIVEILDNVDGGELYGQHFEKSEDEISVAATLCEGLIGDNDLENKIKYAQEKVTENGRSGGIATEIDR